MLDFVPRPAEGALQVPSPGRIPQAGQEPISFGRDVRVAGSDVVQPTKVTGIAVERVAGDAGVEVDVVSEGPQPGWGWLQCGRRKACLPDRLEGVHLRVRGFDEGLCGARKVDGR